MPPKERAARGRNYDPIEDVELARAWVRVSTDPAIGMNQTAERFWSRVKQSMESSELLALALRTGQMEPRTWTSLQARFVQVSRSISKFIRCTQKVEAARESGATERDMLVKALTLFKTETRQSFAYMECYNVLSQCPVFEKNLIREPEKKRKQDSDRAAPVAGNEAKQPDAIDPPMGSNAAKRAKFQDAMLQRSVKAQEKLLTSAESRVRLYEARLRMQQKRDHAQQLIEEEKMLHIMLKDLFDVVPVSDEHREYLRTRRSELIKRQRELEEESRRRRRAPIGFIEDASEPESSKVSIAELCTPQSEDDGDVTEDESKTD